MTNILVPALPRRMPTSRYSATVSVGRSRSRPRPPIDESLLAAAALQLHRLVIAPIQGPELGMRGPRTAKKASRLGGASRA